MVGLSIVLEGQKGNKNIPKPQVINKTTMVLINKPSFLPSSSHTHNNFPSPRSPFFAPAFLDHCFLCKQKLLPGKDIYMYKGDKGFCSVECRYRQIFMDEEESIRKEKKCSFSAMKPTPASASTAPSSSSSAAAANQRKGEKNRAGGFAY